MREADTDNSGTISFGELVTFMHKLKKDPTSASAFVRKIHKAPAQVRARFRTSLKHLSAMREGVHVGMVLIVGDWGGRHMLFSSRRLVKRGRGGGNC